ncbi:hypothetical protein BS47DRAFT_877774 [Hydnum rufescens UP504]|uniref:DUF6533 domain-containing protein n=1 Tax=Hydnum rufescens UP504 TaxID=1448309 RepID=A0A9P6DXE3_9AGAM|nr:hypothetical protein BS47DRAFT_877774 [Hydnum rufescens UP504]
MLARPVGPGGQQYWVVGTIWPVRVTKAYLNPARRCVPCMGKMRDLSHTVHMDNVVAFGWSLPGFLSGSWCIIVKRKCFLELDALSPTLLPPEDLYMSVPWDPAASPSIINEIVWKIELTQHFQSAGLVILIYDYFLTLSDEIKYIWPSKWTLVKIRFPYEPIHLPGGPHKFPNKCIRLHIRCPVLLAVRVHALWGARRSIGIALGIAFVCSTAATLIAATTSASRVSRTVVVIKDLKICIPGVPLPRSYFVVWLPSLLFETTAFLMTMHKVIWPLGKEVHSIASLILRDGVMYFATIFSACLANMILFIHQDPTVTYSGLFLLMGLGSAMVSRMTLNLRTWRTEGTEAPPVGPRRHLFLSHPPHAIRDRTSIPAPDRSDALGPKDDFAMLRSKDVIALKSMGSQV